MKQLNPDEAVFAGTCIALAVVLVAIVIVLLVVVA